MAEQQEGEVFDHGMDIDSPQFSSDHDSSLCDGLSPIVSLEFDTNSDLCPSPQFSSDCINGDSNGDQQLATIPQSVDGDSDGDRQLVAISQPSYYSFQEGRDDRGKRPRIPRIEGDTLWDNFKPNLMALFHDMLSKNMISELGLPSYIITLNITAQSAEPLKDGTKYTFKTHIHHYSLYPPRKAIYWMIPLKYMFFIHTQYVKNCGFFHTVTWTELYISDATRVYYTTENFQQLKYDELYDFTITEISGGPDIGVLKFTMTSLQLCFEKVMEIAEKVVKALIALGYPTNFARHGSQDLQSREEMEKTNPVEQQTILRFDSPYDRGKINESQGKNMDITPVIPKRLRDSITLGKVQQLFELPREKAADRLGVSLSTLRLFCRENGIPQWPYQRRKTDNDEQNIERQNVSVQEAKRAKYWPSHSGGPLTVLVDKSTLNTQNLVFQQREASAAAPHQVSEASQYVQHETRVGGNTIVNIDTLEETRNFHPSRAEERVPESSKTIPPVSSQTRVVASSSPTDPMMQVGGTQDTRKITIKAEYMGKKIRIHLSPSSGIAELQNEVIKRLHLTRGAFTIEYLDSDHEWILIAINDDLQDCLSSSTGIIQMSIKNK